MRAEHAAEKDVAEVIGEVLAVHRWHHTRETHCTCGFRTPLAQLAVKGFDAHVAAHVAEAVTAWLGSEAVVRAAAEAMEDASMRHGRDLGTLHRNDIARAAIAAITEQATP